MRAPTKLYSCAYVPDDAPIIEVCNNVVGIFEEPYLRASWLIDVLNKERNTIRKHLKDDAWKEEWRDLKVVEQVYSEMIYRLHKIK